MAWSRIRSFESGINHITSAALGGAAADGAIDVLLVGMDSRTDAHGNPLTEEELATLRAGDDVSTNTDTIILVRIPNGKSATAISIPATRHRGADMGKTKINGVYGSVQVRDADAAGRTRARGSGRRPSRRRPKPAGGADQDRRQARPASPSTTTPRSACWASLITDALGGVNVCLKEDVYEPLSGADFPAGWQKLDGPQALSFVRQRHDLPRGDLDRVVRQQAVMASLAHE